MNRKRDLEIISEMYGGMGNTIPVETLLYIELVVKFIESIDNEYGGGHYGNKAFRQSMQPHLKLVARALRPLAKNGEVFFKSLADMKRHLRGRAQALLISAIEEDPMLHHYVHKDGEALIKGNDEAGVYPIPSEKGRR